MDEEQTTWRSGEHAWVVSQLAPLVRQLEALERTSTAALNGVDTRAQLANDALQRLLEANITTVRMMDDVRYETAQQALLKVEHQLTLSRETAIAAVEAVDRRSIMRHDSASAMTMSTEEKLLNRIEALRSIIDLRAQMGAEAISKAETATQLRFESVNEFRQTLTDQATQFVTRNVLEATQRQMQTQIENLETQFRAANESLRLAVAGLGEQVASLTGKVLVGGSCLMVILLLVQIFVNFWHPH